MAHRSLHILVLVDRDWTHPQAGGTGANLHAHVQHFLRSGHRVTVVSGAHDGAARYEERDRLVMHRRGGRKSVFWHAMRKVRSGAVSDVDVCLEIVNGIAWLTPLWARGIPRATYIHHVHRDQYVEELGTVGRVAAWCLETTPLKRLYRHGRFITVSEATASQLVALGVDRDAIEVNYHGPEPDRFWPGERSATPRIVYLGRLKRYKRVEVLLEALESVPGTTLDIAGRGEHDVVLAREVEQRGLSDRVVFHGYVSDERRRELLQQAWALVTASAAEGWGLSTLEAAACGTPTVAMGIGGLAESVVHGVTGLLADDVDEFAGHLRALMGDEALRAQLGAAALERARNLGWDYTVERTLSVLREQTALAEPVLAAPLAEPAVESVSPS